MRRNIYIIGGLLILAIILSISGCTITNPSGSIGGYGQNTGIWVTGEGKVSVTPDIAVLSLGVQTEADTVAAAQYQASSAMDAVMKALKDSGITEKDITTQYFSIYPVTNYVPDTGEQKLTGYRVSNTVTVKIREVGKAGNIIDAAAAAGGNNIIVNSISFTVEDPTVPQKDARLKALDDAAAKAKEIADKEGLELGEPTYINEATGTSPVYYSGMALSVPAPSVNMGSSINAGQTEITVDIQVAYKIK